jgi:threonine/homoserine/homoserine lactone efflux protein
MSYIPNPLIIPIGVLIGILLSLPIGPVNLLGLQRAAERGFFGGVAAGIGIMLGDGLIALGAALSVNSVSGAMQDYRAPIQIVGGLAIALAGARLLYQRPEFATAIEVERATVLDYAGDTARLFFLTITNPGAVVFMVAIFGGVSTFVEVSSIIDAFAMVAAIMGGSALYWITVSRWISSIRLTLDANRMAMINRWAGSVLIGFGGLLIAEMGLKRLGVM